MVIGEMAPKSWAIAHRERSAALPALPFRGFTVAVRPLLKLLNGISDLLLRMFRIRPRTDEANPRAPEQLRHLVAESRRLKLIEAEEHAVLSQALRAPATPIASLIIPAAEIVSVPAAATTQQVTDAATASDRSGSICATPTSLPAAAHPPAPRPLPIEPRP
ncbi:CNNM domain-containing protein [Streptosporangium sp. NPDC000396]|uniref:CNNM domain-containing protein n=1 Tax=Streptosporangium sp. NPDC000396 TaxID=3366185 RepID=UPI0036A8688A